MKKILIFCFVLAFVGCKEDFLDRHSLTSINAATFWKTENDGILGINGIYDALQDRSVYSGNLNGYVGLPMYDNFGDNSYNAYKWEGPGIFMIANVDPSSKQLSGLWTSSYKGIFRANLALENIPNIPSKNISDVKKQVLIGQALFLRSLFYINLAVYYQDAPLILKVQNLDEAYVPKNTFQEIYTQVVKDLKTAVDMLPVSYPSDQYGYATKGAALGMLARIQLYNKDYQGVLDATNAMLTLGYSLNPNYSQLFTEQGEFSNEIVFSVRFLQDALSSNGETFSSTYAGIPKVDEQPMPNLVEDYYCTDGKPITTSPLYKANNEKANRDPRLTASVYFKNDIFILDLNRTFKGNTATSYGRKKYIKNLNTSVNGVPSYGVGGQDFIVLRYADVLLMRAEAMVEKNQLSGVSALVNQVRARSGMPSVESVEGTNLSQAQLRTIVRHERRVELAFEGLRFFDLKRWGQVEQAFQRAISDNIAGYAPIYQAGKSEIFPIPLEETQNNENLIQNPVWQ